MHTDIRQRIAKARDRSRRHRFIQASYEVYRRNFRFGTTSALSTHCHGNQRPDSPILDDWLAEQSRDIGAPSQTASVIRQRFESLMWKAHCREILQRHRLPSRPLRRTHHVPVEPGGAEYRRGDEQAAYKFVGPVLRICRVERADSDAETKLSCLRAGRHVFP